MANYQETLHGKTLAQGLLRFQSAERRGGFGRAMLALKAVVTAGMLLLLVHLVDTRILLARLESIPRTLLVVALDLLVMQIGLVAIRWRVIVDALPRPASVLPRPFRFLQITFAAVLLGQALPSVAGDGLRVVLIRDAGLPFRTAVESTVFDRVIALLVLLVLAAPTVALSPLLARAGVSGPATMLITAGLVLSGLAIAAAKPFRRFRLRPIAFAGEVLSDFRSLLADRRFGLIAAGLSAVVHGLSIVVFWVLAQGQGLPLGLLDACAIVPLILLIQMVPVSIGGWGLREGLVVTLLGAGGVGPADALVLSLSFGTLLLVAALPGLAMLVPSTWMLRLRPARA